MSQPSPRSTDADARANILDCALPRLLHFGYHKTTMAEIAEDAGMSAANLYRYFENKQDIVAECAARCLDERLERLRVIARDGASDPRERLERYALELVDDCHALTGPDSRVGELVDMITRERSDLIHLKNRVHCELLEAILADGNTRGIFRIDDVSAAALHVHSALVLFDVPLFVGLYDRAEFERRARGVVALLIDGLTGPAA